MKRSEMVAAITNKYLELSRGGWSEASEEERFSKILSIIEEFGMTPPFSSNMYYKTWRDGGEGYDWDQE